MRASGTTAAGRQKLPVEELTFIFSILDYREIFVETGVLQTTDGSARVRISDETDLLVGVKADITTVDDTRREENRLRFYVDCTANATPQWAGKGDTSTNEAHS